MFYKTEILRKYIYPSALRSLCSKVRYGIVYFLNDASISEFRLPDADQYALQLYNRPFIIYKSTLRKQYKYSPNLRARERRGEYFGIFSKSNI